MNTLENDLMSLWKPYLGGASLEIRFRRVEYRRDEVGQNKPSVRQLEWALARQLEGEVRDGLLGQGVSEKLISTTVSHSSSPELGHWVLVLGSSQRIGVDLESAQRTHHAGLRDWLVMKSEDHLGLTPLEFWVIKEAVFKYNIENEGTFLPQYQILTWDPELRLGSARFASRTRAYQMDCHFALTQKKGWLAAIAFS